MNKKIEPIILVGGGGHCHSVIDVIEQENKYDILGIIDKEEFLNSDILGYKVIGSDKDLQNISKKCKNAIVTVGHIKSNIVRKRLFNELKTIGYRLPTIISPFAYVSRHSTVGKGTVVHHNAIINANVIVGENSIINSQALIEHDSVIGDHCHISTGSIINGGVTIKDDTFIGSNSCSKEGITINSRFIKAGSIIV